MRFAAFDIEIAKVPDGGDDWKEDRPLGITCAAIAYEGSPIDIKTFYSEGPDGLAPQMTREDCAKLVDALEEAVKDDYILVTWNGLGFDFDILAEESGEYERCKQLALAHWDPMFQFFCQKGFPVGLQAVSVGMGLEGKTEGVSGAEAPLMWKDGKFVEVLEYVGQDCVATIDVARAIVASNRVAWVTKRGRRSTEVFKEILSVRECLLLPTPDNSWMTNPMTRQQFIEWWTPSPAEERGGGTFEKPEPEPEDPWSMGPLMEV